MNFIPSTTLYTALVVSCYFLYPSTRGYGLETYKLALLGTLYLAGFIVLLRLVTKQYPLCDNQFSSISGVRDRAWSKYGYVAVILCIFAIYQAFFLSLPILSGPDEAVHVSIQLELYNAFWDSRGSFIFLYLFSSIVIFTLTLLQVWLSKETASKYTDRSLSNGHVLIVHIVGLSLLYLAVYGNLFVADKLGWYWGRELRWPPLGTILGIVSISLFGLSEWSNRLVPYLFYIGTGLFVYKMVVAEKDNPSGLVAAIICLSSPIFLSYGHLSYRETGGAFFIAAGMYYLLKFHKSSSLKFLHLCFFCIAAGYLTRRPTLVLVFILPFFFFWDVWKQKLNGASNEELKQLVFGAALNAVLVVWVIYPWMYFTKAVRPYVLHIENYFDGTILTAYARLLPAVISWPVLCLLGVGLVITLKSRSALGVIALLCFVFIYALFTGDDPFWLPVERFTILMIPAISVLAAMTVSSLGRWYKYMIMIVIVTTVLSVYSWTFDKNLPLIRPKNSTTFSSYPYYPFNWLVEKLKILNVPTGHIIYPAYWQTASSVYYKLYSVNKYRDVIPKWKPGAERSCSIADLVVRCEEVDCQALILRLDKKGAQVKVPWLTDISAENVFSDSIPGFEVESVSFLKNNGLAILIPEAKTR